MSAQNSPAPIDATERDTTLNPRQLRKAGFIPATMYGGHQEPRNIQVRAHEFGLLYRKGNRLFELKGLGVTAQVHKLQVDPTSQDVLSIEFLLPGGEKQVPKKADKPAAKGAGKKETAAKAKPTAEAKAEEPAAEPVSV